MTKGQSSSNKRDPEGTKRRILEAATEEFRLGGLEGARVDRIAKRAETNERMLYYYFGSKEDLFIAVLEASYDTFVSAQHGIDFDSLPPDQALVRFAKSIWDCLVNHPEVVRLINNENLHQARYLKRSKVNAQFSPVLASFKRILERGVVAGMFRNDIDPLRFYMTISALGYYVVSNRYTVEHTFARDFMGEGEYGALVDQHTEMLLSYLRVSDVAMKRRISG